MTDHHDELASAYLDGQLSAEDAARVESDPALLTEVDALAAVVERLQTEEAPLDAGTRQRHLASALAAFDQSAAPTNVIPLDSAVGRSAPGGEPTRVLPQPDDMARRTAKVASATVGGGEVRRLETRRRQGLPSWLSAAAALLVIGGGIAWFAGRQDQGADTAAISADAATTADRTVAGAGTDSEAALPQGAESGPGATATAEAAASDAARPGAEDSAAGGATDKAQTAVPAPAGSSTGASSPPSTAALPSTTTSRAVTSAAPSSGAPLSTTTAQSGVLAFGSVPTGAEVQSRLTANGATPEPAARSSCGAVVRAPAGTTLTGYVPITVDGVAGEGLFYRSASGPDVATVLVVRTSSCQAFS